jgi:hypothetical protein
MARLSPFALLPGGFSSMLSLVNKSCVCLKQQKENGRSPPHQSQPPLRPPTGKQHGAPLHYLPAAHTVVADGGGLPRSFKRRKDVLLLRVQRARKSLPRSMLFKARHAQRARPPHHLGADGRHM